MNNIDYIDTNKIKKFGTILPGGNQDEFPLIREQLKKRNIEFNEFRMSNGIIFYFEESQLNKLPTDDHKVKIKQYLPVDDNSGHSISEMNDILEFFKKTFKNTKEYE
jgi:hypothetical protein